MQYDFFKSPILRVYPENESKTAKKKGKKPRKETAETGKEPEDASQSSLFDF